MSVRLGSLYVSAAPFVVQAVSLASILFACEACLRLSRTLQLQQRRTPRAYANSAQGSFLMAALGGCLESSGVAVIAYLWNPCCIGIWGLSSNRDGQHTAVRISSRKGQRQCLRDVTTGKLSRRSLWKFKRRSQCVSKSTRYVPRLFP